MGIIVVRPPKGMNTQSQTFKWKEFLGWTRLFASIVVAAAAVSMPFNGIWFKIFFVLALSAGLAIAPSALLVARHKGWLRWWHAAIAGALAAMPWTLIYMLLDSYRARIFGQFETIAYGGMGAAAGIIVWLLGVFRNRALGETSSGLPLSLVLLIPVSVVGYVYWEALRPVQVYGCITSYTPVEQPTSLDHYADVDVLTLEGERFRGSVRESRADPTILARCASGFKARSFVLVSTNYFFSDIDLNGCKQACDQFKSGRDPGDQPQLN